MVPAMENEARSHPHITMSLRRANSIGLLLSLLALSAVSQAVDAFHPGAVWPDDKGVAINAHGGGMLRHEGVYYWFGEHKIAGSEGNTAQVGVHVYSSRDLYHWQDGGIAFHVATEPGAEVGVGCILERPKVLYCARTGKFVMWFHFEPKGRATARRAAASRLRASRPDPMNFEAPFARMPAPGRGTSRTRSRRL